MYGIILIAIGLVLLWPQVQKFITGVQTAGLKATDYGPGGSDTGEIETPKGESIPQQLYRWYEQKFGSPVGKTYLEMKTAFLREWNSRYFYQYADRGQKGEIAWPLKEAFSIPLTGQVEFVKAHTAPAFLHGLCNGHWNCLWVHQRPPGVPPTLSYYQIQPSDFEWVTNAINNGSLWLYAVNFN